MPVPARDKIKKDKERKKRALDAIEKRYGKGCVAAKNSMLPILRRPVERKVLELEERLKQRDLSLTERKELRLKLIEMMYGKK